MAYELQIVGTRLGIKSECLVEILFDVPLVYEFFYFSLRVDVHWIHHQLLNFSLSKMTC